MEKDNVYVLFEEIKNKIEMINGKLEQKTGTPVLTSGQVKHFLFWLEWDWYAACPYGEISDFGSPTGNMQTMP